MAEAEEGKRFSRQAREEPYGACPKRWLSGPLHTLSMDKFHGLVNTYYFVRKPEFGYTS